MTVIKRVKMGTTATRAKRPPAGPRMAVPMPAGPPGMYAFQDQITDENAVPIPGAQVWVFNALDGTAATIYAPDGSTLIQPLLSDEWGFFGYYVPAGGYQNEIHYGGQLRFVQQVGLGPVVATVADGDKGDITVSGGGLNWQIDPGAVGTPELADSAVTSVKIANGAVGTADLADGAVTLAKSAIPVFTNVANGLAPASGGGNKFLRADAAFAALAPSDLTSTAGETVICRAAGGIGSFGELIVGADTLVGRLSGNDIGALTGIQVNALLGVFTNAAKGLAPASGGGTVNFLRADGTWAAPPSGTGGGGLTDGDKGDVVVSGGGAGLTVESATPAGGTFAVTGKQTIVTTTGVGLSINQGNQTSVDGIYVTNVGPASPGLHMIAADNAEFWIAPKASGDGINNQINVAGGNRSFWFEVFNNAYDASPHAFMFAQSAGGTRDIIRIKNKQVGGTNDFLRMVDSTDALKAKIDSSGVHYAAAFLSNTPLGFFGFATDGSMQLAAGIAVGAYLCGRGGTYDLSLGNRAGTSVINILAGTTTTSFAGLVLTPASAAGGAGFNLPHGAAPSAPVNGDIWTTTAGLFARINAVTVQTLTGGPITTSGLTMNTARLLGRTSAGTGALEELTAAAAKTFLGIVTTDVAAVAGNVVSVNASAAAAAYSELAMAANTFVGRGASGNIAACTLGATLAFAGAALGVAKVPNALTINNVGSGAASGATYDGSAAVTISSNTIGAAPAALASVYHTLLDASGYLTAADVQGVYGLPQGQKCAITGVGTLYPSDTIYIAAADYPAVGALNPKLRIRAQVFCNDVAPGATFTFGLLPITRSGTTGGAGLSINNLGAAVSGSTVAVVTPAADSSNVVVTADFALPADGHYVIGVTTSVATIVASAHVHISALLQLHHA